MSEPLLGLTTQKLLEKFGAGSHKPGSGSAAALQGMLSAQLILTVIDLTFDPRRRDKYVAIIPQLNEIDSAVRGHFQVVADGEKLAFFNLFECSLIHI